ncbi:carboxypeptidase-like regulatory domain-containing protein [Marinilabilia rubra]|nr:carboxypeptidase-like regulatory domain-containing protein [Marinilabilia rubra]
MQAKKNILILTAFLGLFWLGAIAQEKELSGKVLDASNGRAVEFANLGITGTFKGDATDQDGVFSIRIKPDLYQNRLRVSAVGYETKEFLISRLIENNPLIINLQPMVYGIDEVDVEAPSRILYGMLKDAIRKLKDNYVTGVYSAELQYSESVDEKERNLTLDYTDLSGYQERTRRSAFTDRNYKIIEGVRNFDITPFANGLHRVEELLGFDFLRHPGNVLDSAFVDYYSVWEMDNYLKNGKQIMVIAFESKNPKYEYSGDAQIESLKGEIHLDRDELSILEISASYQSNGRFRYGRSFFVNEELADINDTGELEYSVKVVYDDIANSKKALKSVKYIIKPAKAGAENSSYELVFNNFSQGEMSVTEKSRQYYDDVSIFSSGF